MIVTAHAPRGVVGSREPYVPAPGGRAGRGGGASMATQICRICGRPCPPRQLRDARCPMCTSYWRRHGVERPRGAAARCGGPARPPLPALCAADRAAPPRSVQRLLLVLAHVRLGAPAAAPLAAPLPDVRTAREAAPARP